MSIFIILIYHAEKDFMNKFNNFSFSSSHSGNLNKLLLTYSLLPLKYTNENLAEMKINILEEFFWAYYLTPS